MGLSENSERIAVVIWRGYCDVCSRSIEPKIFQAAELKLNKTTAKRDYYFIDCRSTYDSVPPITKKMLLSEANDEGWELTTFRGKEMFVCPDCRSK